MIWRLAAIAALMLAGTASAQQAMPGDAAAKAKLRQAGAEVLFWSQAQRDANFRQMERLFPTVTVNAGGKTRALPPGRALPVPAAEVDKYIANQNIAGRLCCRTARSGWSAMPAGSGRLDAGRASRSPSR